MSAFLDCGQSPLLVLDAKARAALAAGLGAGCGYGLFSSAAV